MDSVHRRRLVAAVAVGSTMLAGLVVGGVAPTAMAMATVSGTSGPWTTDSVAEVGFSAAQATLAVQGATGAYLVGTDGSERAFLGHRVAAYPETMCGPMLLTDQVWSLRGQTVTWHNLKSGASGRITVEANLLSPYPTGMLSSLPDGTGNTPISVVSTTGTSTPLATVAGWAEPGRSRCDDTGLAFLTGPTDAGGTGTYRLYYVKYGGKPTLVRSFSGSGAAPRIWAVAGSSIVWSPANTATNVYQSVVGGSTTVIASVPAAMEVRGAGVGTGWSALVTAAPQSWVAAVTITPSVGTPVTAPLTLTNTTAVHGAGAGVWLLADNDGVWRLTSAGASRLWSTPCYAPVQSVAATNRYATAASLLHWTPMAASPTIYVASGQNFPDALAAGPAAVASHGGLLLTGSTSLPLATASALAQVKPGRIIVLGGPDVVSDSVVSALSAYAPTQRTFGADRYATAAAASADRFAAGVPVVYLASGNGFADALAGSAAAGIQHGPILLTTATSLPAATAVELTRLKPQRIVILGGTDVISSAVAQVVSGYAPVTRLFGADRYATAAAVSRAINAPTALPYLYIAPGTTFPDALAAGVAAAGGGSPLLLTSPTRLPSATAAEVARLRPVTNQVVGAASTDPVRVALEAIIWRP